MHDYSPCLVLPSFFFLLFFFLPAPWSWPCIKIKIFFNGSCFWAGSNTVEFEVYDCYVQTKSLARSFKIRLSIVILYQAFCVCSYRPWWDSDPFSSWQDNLWSSRSCLFPSDLDVGLLNFSPYVVCVRVCVHYLCLSFACYRWPRPALKSRRFKSGSSYGYKLLFSFQSRSNTTTNKLITILIRIL